MKRCLAILALATAQLCAVELPTITRSFLEQHCYDYDFNFTQPTDGQLMRGEFARRLWQRIEKQALPPERSR
ncbi:MAG: hypothetical protein EBS05_07910 [Proteobacteria bacterium]|nr:hypothetical protein [Pseudomonadota bacterium]